MAGKTKKTASLTALDIEKAARSLQAKTGSARKATPQEKASLAAAKRVQTSLRRAGVRGATSEAKRSAGEWKLVITLAAAHAELLEGLVGAAR